MQRSNGLQGIDYQIVIGVVSFSPIRIHILTITLSLSLSHTHTHMHTHTAQFNMLREVEFSSTNSAQQLLPVTQPIRFHFEDYHFQDICFY